MSQNRYISSALLVLGVVVLVTQYTNCDKSGESTLYSSQDANFLNNTSCDLDDKVCIQTGANKNEIELRILSANPYMVVAGDTKVVIGGECNISKFPDSVIRTVLTDPDNNQVIARDARSECAGGRFDVTLDLPLGFNVVKRLELKAEIFAIDKAGKEYSNSYLGQKIIDVIPYH